MSQKSPITTVQSFGSQGGVASFVLTITAGPAGINAGDFGILLSHQKGSGFLNPRIESITDSLGNSWTHSTVDVNGRNGEQFYGFQSPTYHTLAFNSAVMATAVAPGATFQITVGTNLSGGTQATLEMDFISLTGMTLDVSQNNGATYTAGKGSDPSGTAMTFSSRTTPPTTNLFYIAFGFPFGTLVSYPSIYTAVQGLSQTFAAATFYDTTGASATDVWTQDTNNQWGAFQLGFPFSGFSESGTIQVFDSGQLSIWNPSTQQYFFQKSCSGSALDSEYQTDSSTIVVGTSPVQISLSDFNIDSGVIKNIGAQALEVTMGASTITLQPGSFVKFAGLEYFSSITLQTASGTTQVEYLIAG